MIGFVRRCIGWLAAAPRAIGGRREWTHPSSVITESIDLSLELDGGLIRPGDLRLERAFEPAAAVSPVAPAVPTPRAQPAPTATQERARPAADTSPSTEPAAEREEPQRRPGQAA